MLCDDLSGSKNFVDIFLFGIYDVGIHGIVKVVNADVPRTHTVFGLPVEVDADVQPVGGRKLIVVPVRNVVFLTDTTVGLDDDGLPFGYSHVASGVEYPRSTYIDAVAELVVQAEVHTVTAVVLVRTIVPG